MTNGDHDGISAPSLVDGIVCIVEELVMKYLFSTFNSGNIRSIYDLTLPDGARALYYFESNMRAEAMNIWQELRRYSLNQASDTQIIRVPILINEDSYQPVGIRLMHFIPSVVRLFPA